MDDPSVALILEHPLEEASVFTAEALIEDVRRLSHDHVFVGARRR